MNDLFQQEFNRTGQAIRELAARIRKLEIHTHELDDETGGFLWQILHFHSGVLAGVYPTSAVGLDAALGVSVAGDIVYIPDCTIPGDHALIAGVALIGLSRWNSILTGLVTGADGAYLENLTVRRTASDGTNLEGIKGGLSGWLYLYSCNIEIEQSGAGNAYAINAAYGGNIETWDCRIEGTASGGGAGYAARSSNGIIHIYAGRCHGSTDRFLTIITP